MVECCGKGQVQRTHGKSEEPELDTRELVADVRRDETPAFLLAGRAKAVTAVVRDETVPEGLVEGTLDPRVGTTPSEALELGGPFGNGGTEGRQTLLDGLQSSQGGRTLT